MTAAAVRTFQEMKFAQRQRFVFMEAVAFWEGAVGRERIADVFRVTENHVTRDFTRYRTEFPNNLVYDLSARTYRPSLKFTPKVSTGSPEEYLSLLRAYLESSSTAVVPTINEGVAAVALPRFDGRVDPAILRAITRALSGEAGLRITYQSLQSEMPKERDIWPHALVLAGNRCYVRAYDEHYSKFIDLVPQRMLKAQPLEGGSPVAVSADQDWQLTVTVEIGPATRLSSDQKKVIASEYGMTLERSEWVWRTEMKRCLVPYFRRWFRLDLAEKDSYPIRLINAEALKELKFGWE